MLYEVNDKNDHSSSRTESISSEKLSEPDETFDIIEATIGGLGRWQISICCAAAVTKIIVASHLLSIVFLGAAGDFWCKPPKEFETLPVHQWKNISEPVRNGYPTACHVYDTEYILTYNRTVFRDPGNDKPCQVWEYNRSEFPQTIITEWDLVCDRRYLIDVSQGIFMFGVLIGSAVFGIIADKFGRKTSLMLTIVVQIVGGIGTAFTPWLALFLAMRFLTATAGGGQLVISFVMCMEFVSRKWRSVVLALYQVPFSLGVVALAGVGYLVRHWRYLQFTLSVPPLLLLSYYWLIPESPRWLLAVGKTEEAITVLEKAAKFNNLDPSHIRSIVLKHSNSQTKNTNENKTNILDLIRTPNMRLKTLCILVSWTACGISFFGLHQYLGQIGNMFVNVAVSGLTEIPGFLASMYFLDKFGRKKTTIGSLLLTAVSSLLVIAVVLCSNAEWARVTLAGLGIIGISLSFGAVYLYSGELFPTVVRNAGIGAGSMFARIGAIVAPFIVSLNNENKLYPPLIFGILPLVAAILCLPLPETLNTQLPNTIEEGELFGKKIKKGEDNKGYVSEMSQKP